MRPNLAEPAAFGSVPSSVVGKRLGQAAALLVLGSVLVGYSMTLRIGIWPIGHPWSGITLVGVALLNLGIPRPHLVLQRVTLGFGLVLTVVAAFLWLAAAFTQISH